MLVPVSNVDESIDWNSIKQDYRTLSSKDGKTRFEDLENHIVSESIVTPDDWGSSTSTEVLCSIWLTVLIKCYF